MSTYSGANVAVLCATICFTLSGIFSWYKVLPVCFREMGASKADVGLAFMLITFSYRGPQVIGGLLADRFSRRAITVVGTLLMAPFYAAAALMTTWQGMLACLCAVWVIGALQWPALLSLLTESTPPQRRGRAIGWLDFCSILGFIVGPVWGAAILSMPGGDVRHLLLITAGLYVAMGVARLFLLRNVASREEEIVSTGPARGPVIFVALLMAMAGFVAYYLLWDGPFGSMYLQDVYGLSKPDINVNAAIAGALAMAAALLGGALVDRIGPYRFITITFAAMAACTVPFLFGELGPTSSRFPYGAGYALVAAASFPVEAYLLSYQRIITSIGPARRRSLFVGLFGSAVGLIAGGVNYVAGHMYERHGFDGPMALATVGCAVGAILAVVIGVMIRDNRRAAASLSPS